MLFVHTCLLIYQFKGIQKVDFLFSRSLQNDLYSSFKALLQPKDWQYLSCLQKSKMWGSSNILDYNLKKKILEDGQETQQAAISVFPTTELVFFLTNNLFSALSTLCS